MLMYKRADVQTHYLEMLSAQYHIKYTHANTKHTKSYTENLKTDVALTHKTIQEPEQWLLFVVSDKKSAVQFSLVFVKRKDNSYILNQQAHQTPQITHTAKYG